MRICEYLRFASLPEYLPWITQSCLHITVLGAGLEAQVSCFPGQYMTQCVTGDSHRLFLTLKLQDHHFSHTQCDCFRDTLTAAWLCLLLQAISEAWRRWVCVCLGSGSRFSLSSAIAKLLCNRTPPPSATSAAILPLLLAPLVGSVCMCHTALGSVPSGTAGIRGHGS